MRTKSIINRDSIFGQKKPLDWGEVIAETYWRLDKNGGVVQSEPATDEILNKLFWPYVPRSTVARFIWRTSIRDSRSSKQQLPATSTLRELFLNRGGS